jgi:hypothetical protein
MEDSFVQSLGLAGSRICGRVAHLDVRHNERNSKLESTTKNVCSEQRNAAEIELLGKKKKKVVITASSTFLPFPD